ncbi:hypothetical protein ACFSJU_13560 [Paradesertivirga mongoliensis]|uniref:DUF4412 domain-containing protein n=1 Tax=Paradesertivirga mongoliensis TaxID=2100740 RepID=A0ABW4ZMV4_9SPHI|nr:hypothetical protein [Pedobacter mongoliensis]
MKKLILSAALALSVTLGFSQKKITEGSITYQVEYEVPANMQAMKASLPTEVKVYFKGDSTSASNKSAMYSSNLIMNPKTEYQRLLLEIPMMNKKLSVRFTPDDIETMKESFPELTFTEGAETKSVASYTGKKYTVSDKKTGKSADAYFTKEIEIPANSLTQYFDKQYGFPLEFTTSQQGMTVRALVKEIKEEKVPAGSFSASKDYEEISFSQLQGMMGRR